MLNSNKYSLPWAPLDKLATCMYVPPTYVHTCMMHACVTSFIDRSISSPNHQKAGASCRQTCKHNWWRICGSARITIIRIYRYPSSALIDLLLSPPGTTVLRTGPNPTTVLQAYASKILPQCYGPARGPGGSWKFTDTATNHESRAINHHIIYIYTVLHTVNQLH